jgi:hypothetical protein
MLVDLYQRPVSLYGRDSDMDNIGIVELRQYKLKPGGRDVLVDLFERHFIEPQEELGAHILGYFRDLEDPDRFVWLRGFRDMVTRKVALETFYSSDIWSANRAQVIDVLEGSENVLMLHPACGMGFAEGSTDLSDGSGMVIATIWPFKEAVRPEIRDFFCREIASVLTTCGANVSGILETEPSENNFPRLPIREGENVVVVLSRFESWVTCAAHIATLEQSRRWTELATTLATRMAERPQTLKLAPAALSHVA